MTQFTKYRTTSAQFLAQAFEELEKGDLLQGSEKGWGAAAQAVKAVARQRGWEHKSHADLFVVVRHLVAELEDEDLHSDFHAARALHINFYEGDETAEGVRHGLGQIQRFVTTLDQQLD